MEYLCPLCKTVHTEEEWTETTRAQEAAIEKIYGPLADVKVCPQCHSIVPKNRIFKAGNKSTKEEKVKTWIMKK